MRTFYFNKIALMPSYHLASAQMILVAKKVKCDFMPWTDLNIIGLVEVSEKEIIEKGIRLYEINIKAKMHNEIELPSVPLVAKLSDIAEKSYLVGWHTRPHAIFTTLKTYAAAASDGAGCYLSGSIKSPYPLLEIV